MLKGTHVKMKMRLLRFTSLIEECLVSIANYIISVGVFVVHFGDNLLFIWWF